MEKWIRLVRRKSIFIIFLYVPYYTILYSKRNKLEILSKFIRLPWKLCLQFFLVKIRNSFSKYKQEIFQGWVIFSSTFFREAWKKQIRLSVSKSKKFDLPPPLYFFFFRINLFLFKYVYKYFSEYLHTNMLILLPHDRMGIVKNLIKFKWFFNKIFYISKISKCLQNLQDGLQRINKWKSVY